MKIRRVCVGSVATAFTRLEALALVSGGILLGAFQLPLVAVNREHSQLAVCLSHLRQVHRAWMLYAMDNGGRLVGADSDSTGNQTSGPGWTGGTVLDFNSGNPSNWDTNQFPARSPLWSYAGQGPSVFRCPADPARVRIGSGTQAGVIAPRTRSLSLNGWVGGPAWAGSLSQGWRVIDSLDSFVDPGPARTLTFLDEREDSINDGYFAIDMTGFAPGTAWGAESVRLVDLPAYWHDRGASLAFADGHADIRRWVDPRTTPVPTGGLLPLNVPSPFNQDVYWMQDHATRLNRPQ